MTFRDSFENLCNFWWIPDDILMILVSVGWLFDEFTDRAVAARFRLSSSFLGSLGSFRGAFCDSFVALWWLGGDFWMTFYDLVVTFGWLFMTWWWILVDFLWRGSDFWMTFGWLSVTPLRFFATCGEFQMTFWWFWWVSGDFLMNLRIVP
jgi:hypothetical protein